MMMWRPRWGVSAGLRRSTLRRRVDAHGAIRRLCFDFRNFRCVSSGASSTKNVSKKDDRTGNEDAARRRLPTDSGLWWFKREGESDASGPHTSDQMKIWARGGGLGSDVLVSQNSTQSSSFVRLAEQPFFEAACAYREAHRHLDPPKKETKFQRVKRMFKEYGFVFICTYSSAWMTTFVPIFGALEMGALDCVSLIETIGLDSVIETQSLNVRMINFIVAVEVNELLEIGRLPLVAAATPSVATWWRARKERRG